MSDHTFELTEFDKHKSNLSAIKGEVDKTITQAQTLPNPIMYGLIAGPLIMGAMTAATYAAGQYVGGLGGAFGEVESQINATKTAYETTESDNTSASRGMGN
ncbi:hypothetical protein ACQBAR_13315 [Propionibacteriaceae bacterium Y1685]|uniref:hypothetical protein n=1 Tax=Microlunatus sp. Y1700 TaxID=3418487 RepID=UPI003B805FA2